MPNTPSAPFSGPDGASTILKIIAVATSGTSVGR
jgi:hypothetical protein